MGGVETVRGGLTFPRPYGSGLNTESRATPNRVSSTDLGYRDQPKFDHQGDYEKYIDHLLKNQILIDEENVIDG